MTARGLRGQKGSVSVEFALAGVSLIMVLISTFALAVGMWNYHTLAYMVHEATRYSAVHGISCTTGGNSCAITVGNIATVLSNLGIGVPSNQVNVTLTTNSGAQTTCNPLNTCLSNATVWPPSSNSDNAIGASVSISAMYNYKSPLLFFWPGKGSFAFGQVWFPASSSQRIIF